MRKYPTTIEDRIGNRHPRKNQYLAEAAELQDKYEQWKADAQSHPYNQKLREFQDAERVYLSGRKDKKALLLRKSDLTDRYLKKWTAELPLSVEDESFYAPYVELTYDAQLAHDTALQKQRHLQEMITSRSQLLELIAKKEKSLEEAKAQDRSVIKEQIQHELALAKKEYDETKKQLKEKFRNKIISAKALRNETEALKQEYKDRTAVLELMDPVRSISEELSSLKHHLKVDAPEQENILLADISDLRRNTPVESKKESPLRPWLSLLIPGAGQLANGQPVKALLFFLGTLFTWLIAVPYALGYGNYQGKGIAGLLTLAQGGKKVHRSMIFMIEGIVAILLILIAVGIYYFAVHDARKVFKEKGRGIRPLNWFETKKQISENGFPYLVSSPAFFVILFIVLVPVITTILLSFTNMGPKHQSKFFWDGLSNYRSLALGQGVAGKAFWLILGWTLIWTLGATTLAIVIGFVLSLLVNQERVIGKRVWRTIYLLPWAVPAFITIMFFSIMLAPQGPLTDIISKIVGYTVNVKNDGTLTRIALICLQGWLGSSYVFLLSTGILQSIPKDLYEAAEIDGATGFQQTRHITIPLLLFQIAPLLITQYTFNFNNYSIIAIFNDGGPFAPSKYGNLAGASDILISYIFKLTISNKYQALGAAISVLISIFLMFISFLGFRKTKAFSE